MLLLPKMYIFQKHANTRSSHPNHAAHHISIQNNNKINSVLDNLIFFLFGKFSLDYSHNKFINLRLAQQRNKPSKPKRIRFVRFSI